MSNDIFYAILEKALTDNAFLKELLSNPDATIRKEGLTDLNEIAKLKNLFSLLVAALQQSLASQKFMEDQIKSTSETGNAFKEGLRKTIEQIDSGFRSTMTMYKVAFYLGVALIICSLVFAVFKGGALLPIVFGGLGIADFIGFFITKPPQELQGSRANLAQLQAVYFNWYVDVYNWNSYLLEMGRVQGLDYAKIKQVSTNILENTDKYMAMIEKYCELVK